MRALEERKSGAIVNQLCQFIRFFKLHTAHKIELADIKKHRKREREEEEETYLAVLSNG